MAQCNKCGLPIQFKKVGAKWHPRNADGSEHWDACKRNQRQEKPIENNSALYTTTKNTHFWCGGLPPWDDSLGDFRDFTEQEKTERLVCTIESSVDSVQVAESR